VCVRKRFSDQICKDSDYSLPISSINVTFGGNSGILNSAQPQSLWQMSVRNGSNQSWAEFSGKVQIGGNAVNTCGPVLALSFGRDIPITDPFVAPCSLGNFAFQIKVDGTNTSAENFGGTNQNLLELFLVFVHPGIFVNELSTSSMVTGFIDKSTVEKVSGEEHQDQNGIKRIYGGSLFSSMGKVLKGLKPFAKPAASMARKALESSSNPNSQRVGKALGSLGAGMSAGSYTAGGSGSGDRLKHRLM
jgi:hypothetical protein